MQLKTNKIYKKKTKTMPTAWTGLTVMTEHAMAFQSKNSWQTIINKKTFILECNKADPGRQFLRLGNQTTLDPGTVQRPSSHQGICKYNLKQSYSPPPHPQKTNKPHLKSKQKGLINKTIKDCHWSQSGDHTGQAQRGVVVISTCYIQMCQSTFARIVFTNEGGGEEGR